MGRFKSTLLNTLNFLLATTGFKLVRKHLGYISAKETVDAAKRSGLSVCDYVEKIWNQQGDTQRVIDKMKELGIFNGTIKNICEIGTGTGRYLEKIIKICNPTGYESYETAKDWAEWLANKYNIIAHDADGKSLSYTKSSSIDLVHAHGVFIYLPFLSSYRYFQEIVRVTNDNGYVTFDIYSEDCFDDDTVNHWLQSDHNYPCFLSKQYVKYFFVKRGFSLIGDFFNRYGEGKSHYLVFKKRFSSTC